jgi:hypothetical protein
MKLLLDMNVPLKYVTLLANIDSIRHTMGAEELEQVVARVEIDRVTYLFFFEAARYDGRWYIHQFGGNLAALLGIAFWHAGVVPEAELLR